jgi:hypothetical protein
MKTHIENTGNSSYFPPQIEIIKLDNDVSLQLESEPPIGPGELTTLAPDYFNSDPLKNNLG